MRVREHAHKIAAKLVKYLFILSNIYRKVLQLGEIKLILHTYYNQV